MADSTYRGSHFTDIDGNVHAKRTDFQTAYDKHTAYFFAELFGPASDGPQKFGAGYVTDVCRCGHERGSHWDGDGPCDPATCGCRIFREQQA